MKKSLDLIRTPFVWLITIFLINLFLRSIFLSTTPAYVTHDEIIYSVEAQTIRLSGHDISGTWNPFMLKPSHVLYAELPGTLMVLGTFFSNEPMIRARVLHVIVGSLFPFLLAALAYQLTKKKEIGWITLLVTSFNPWVFQFSRMGFDALFSLFFYFSGILVAIRLKGWQKLWSIPFFFLGFFQYQGLKVVFVPMVIMTALYVIWEEMPAKKKFVMKNNLPALVLAAFSVVFFGWYLIHLKSESASNRLNDLVFFNQDYISHIVNEQRRLTLINPLMSVMSNKVVVIAVEVATKYIKGFDLGLIFAYGEPFRNPFSVYSLGMFHLIDFVFVAVGLVTIWMKKELRKVAVFLTALILIAPLPVAINTIDAWIMFRAALLYPVLMILVAVGLYETWKWLNRFGKFGLVATYVLFVGWFGYQYFFRYPLYSTKGQYFAERVMDNYIKRAGEGKKVLVLASESDFIYQGYLFYNNLITKNNLGEIHQAIQTHKPALGNVSFDTNCVDLSTINKDTIIITEAIGTECPGKTLPAGVTATKVAIPSLLDSGAIFRVYNDTFCSKYNLPGFSQVNQRRMLDVEKLSDEEFCRNLFSY
jgi:hypothetical protein